MKRGIAVLILSCLLACNANAAGKRVALVIGISAYKHTEILPNPTNDSADIASVLTQLGFKVLHGQDLSKADFERLIREFSTELDGAELGLFFYAGHGLQVAGQNYLVPVDAQLSSASALDFEMVRLDLVHRTMERSALTNIIFLDACRNNPLERNLRRSMGTRSAEIGKGLAVVESGVGTLISFSTQPGNVALDGVGRNSPFTSALVRHLANSSDDLSAILIAVRNDVMWATQKAQVPVGALRAYGTAVLPHELGSEAGFSSRRGRASLGAGEELRGPGVARGLRQAVRRKFLWRDSTFATGHPQAAWHFNPTGRA